LSQSLTLHLMSGLTLCLDTVRTLCFGRFSSMTDSLGQSNGIRQARISGISDGSCNPQAYTVIIITSKFSCIGPLYHRRGNHLPCRSHRWQFVPTRPDHVRMWWISSAAELHSTLPHISRYIQIYLHFIIVEPMAHFLSYSFPRLPPALSSC
jgi:hypothetical protein